MQGGVDTGWTFYTPYSHDVFQRLCDGRRHRHLYQRVFIDPDGLEFYRHRAHDARAGNDLVPDAAVRLGALRDQPGDDSGTPVIAITLLLLAIERFARIGIFDPAIGGDPILVPALVLVLFPPGGLHHDLAGNGRGQRIDHQFFAQEDFRLRIYRVLQHRDRGVRLSSFGDITCSSAGSRCMPGWFFRS